MATSKTTIDHDEIRAWVEARGGCPARVKTTGRGTKDPGILRIDYTGFAGQTTLETMPWDDWFAAFDRDGLAFVCSLRPDSRFSKLVARANVAVGGAKKRTPASRGAVAKRTPAAAKKRRGSAGTRAKAAAKKTTAGGVRAKRVAAGPKRTAAAAKGATPARKRAVGKKSRATGMKKSSPTRAR